MDDVGALHTTASPTASLAQLILGMRHAPPSYEGLTVAKQALLDWLGVAIAGRSEPLVGILADELAPKDESGGVTLIGRGRRARLETAVLINGAMGHALDFDDVIVAMGHPTAPVAPVALGLAEALGASGAQSIAAFIAGVEMECRVGRLMGASHYAKGWHGTGTFGSFGAAAAAAHLLGLGEEPLLHAMGLAGAQAAGLKSVFGTMTKPLQAGKAAQNGLMAARLAARGFTSDTDILGSAQGFADTQSTSVSLASALESRPLPWVADTLFKYHAACYLTHNAIEAAAALRATTPFEAHDVEAVTVRVQKVHLGVCNIEAPRTGLECKFSLRMTTALALSDEDTFDEGLFTDATAVRPDLVALRQRIAVEPTAEGAGSTVEVRLRDGRMLSGTADVAVPVRDLDRQQEHLERKFRYLTRRAMPSQTADQIIALTRDLEHEPDVSGLLRLCSHGLRA